MLFLLLAYSAQDPSYKDIGTLTPIYSRQKQSIDAVTPDPHVVIIPPGFSRLIPAFLNKSLNSDFDNNCLVFKSIKEVKGIQNEFGI